MDYDKVWESMNSLEGTICNACSVREVIESAITALEERDYKKAEALMNASYQFLKYFIDDFDTHFKVAWDETIGKIKKEEPCMPEWGHSDMEYLAKQTPEEKPLNLGGVSYTYDEAFAAGWEQSLDGCWHPPKEDKVLKWQLPVELHPSGEYYFTLPDDLLEAAGIKEGDELIWEEKEDGSFLLKK
jgi:hypothetical protein